MLLACVCVPMRLWGHRGWNPPYLPSKGQPGHAVGGTDAGVRRQEVRAQGQGRASAQATVPAITRKAQP